MGVDEGEGCQWEREVSKECVHVCVCVLGGGGFHNPIIQIKNQMKTNAACWLLGLSSDRSHVLWLE